MRCSTRRSKWYVLPGGGLGVHLGHAGDIWAAMVMLDGPPEKGVGGRKVGVWDKYHKMDGRMDGCLD